tara:strand:- start:100 stop:729 length:630 start_codon:yes stop_codon:yes gene_type:complete
MTGTVKIHGKEYKTVALRIQEFREKYPGHTILTELVEANDTLVIVKATISWEGVVIATGYAEEVRTASKINRTSALENAETSAVGRALAFFGLGGSEIASADEVANAINQQNAQPVIDELNWLVAHNEACMKHLGSIYFVKEYLNFDDPKWDSAAEAFAEIPSEDQELIWKAPSKGGLFTTKERQAIQSTEFNQAMKKYLTDKTGESNE